MNRTHAMDGLLVCNAVAMSIKVCANHALATKLNDESANTMQDICDTLQHAHHFEI